MEKGKKRGWLRPKMALLAVGIVGFVAFFAPVTSTQDGGQYLYAYGSPFYWVLVGQGADLGKIPLWGFLFGGFQGLAMNPVFCLIDIVLVYAMLLLAAYAYRALKRRLPAPQAEGTKAPVGGRKKKR